MTIFFKMECLNLQKIELWNGFGVYWEVLGATWGASWALLEAFWASWRGLGGILGGTWGILEGFESSWRHFGAILGRLGRLLMVFWEVLEASRDYLDSIFLRFSGILRNL